MPLRNTPTSYGIVAQLLHWVTFALVIMAWTLGVVGDEAPRSLQKLALFVHVTLGVLLILAVVCRSLWRLADPAPQASSGGVGSLAVQLASWMHILLYALLLIVPVVGIVVQFSRGATLPILGVFEIASPWAADRSFARGAKEVHEVLAHLLLLAAGLHALAALYHHQILKDQTLTRMAGWIRPRT